MDKKVADFLAKERICSLTTMLPNGYPHSSIMYYSHSDNPLTLYFSTDINSTKCLGFKKSQNVKSSVVIGFNEKQWITMQMRGNLSMVEDPKLLDSIKLFYFKKNPSAKQYEGDPNTVFLAFEPNYWKYADYKVEPPEIIASE